MFSWAKWVITNAQILLFLVVEVLELFYKLKLFLKALYLSIQVKQETDKSAAVATVVAAVDMARVREPVISAVEQTAQRTTTTAVHVQPAQKQVIARPPGGAGTPLAQLLLPVIGHSNPLLNQTVLKAGGHPVWPRLLELPEEEGG